MSTGLTGDEQCALVAPGLPLRPKDAMYRYVARGRDLWLAHGSTLYSGLVKEHVHLRGAKARWAGKDDTDRHLATRAALHARTRAFNYRTSWSMMASPSPCQWETPGFGTSRRCSFLCCRFVAPVGFLPTQSRCSPNV